MARLEDIRTSSKVRDVAGDAPVTAVAVEWFGNYTLILTYRTEAG